jgi:hypothetical protein
VSAPPATSPTAGRAGRSDAPATTFSLLLPLRRGLADLRRSPVATLAPVAALLLPLLPLVLAADWVLRTGGDVALQGLLVGGPRDGRDVLIARPDGDGIRSLLLLALVVATAVGAVVAAALVAGGPHVRRASPAGAVRDAWRAWPLAFVVLVVQLWALGAAVLLLALLASLAGGVRFQLHAVVLVVGLVLLVVGATRLSLWPAIALHDDVGPRTAARRAWRATASDPVRAVLALLLPPSAALALALAAGAVVGALLGAAASAELVVLSPAAIDAWAMLPLVPGVVVGGALAGRAADALRVRLDA